ncbi:nucleotidyltransferase domain-containing protein [Synechococcus sp. 8F6]|uniref:nucleotidyltransferase domain-containing protein n=1 Tax=Synechococcus sp. 8F6 TaxID=2025606 RepID=UPI001E4BB119|nr:nucleotidyltransferase domain-containing protein [Synechococcus sp. 8F6]
MNRSAGCKAKTPSAMPVRSLTQSVLRWPQPEQVLHEARAWADEQRRLRPSLRRIGVFGSYGRGAASVGSDLDLLLIDEAVDGPQHRRLCDWPLERLPLSCDALVLTPAELEQLFSGSSRMAQELQSDLLWLN